MNKIERYQFVIHASRIRYLSQRVKAKFLLLFRILVNKLIYNKYEDRYLFQKNAGL